MIRLELREVKLGNMAEVLDDPEIEPRLKNKLLVVTRHHEQVRHGVIARCLKVSADQVTKILKIDQNEGLQGILENRCYQPASRRAPFWPCLQCSFQVAPVAHAKQAVQRIQQLTGVSLSESQSRRIMKRLGLALRQCGQLPGQADPQRQFEFLQTQLQPRLREAAAGRRKVFFVEAAHFVLGAFLGMIWCFFAPLGEDGGRTPALQCAGGTGEPWQRNHQGNHRGQRPCRNRV